MTSALTKYAANRMLKGELKKYANKPVAGDTDPLYAMVDDPKRPGKMKKVKKLIPTYIPDHDAQILAKMRKRAYRMDCSLFNFAGTRFGWSAVYGFFPGIGDAFDAIIALLIVWRATSITDGLPASVLMQMMINIAIDFVIGLVPFLGDIADAYWKANTKNVRVLEKHLDAKYKPAEETSRKTRRNQQPATVYEDFGSEEDERRQFMQETDGTRDDVGRPKPVADRHTKQSRGGWFSGGRSSRREADVERGEVVNSRQSRNDVQENGTAYNGRR